MQYNADLSIFMFCVFYRRDQKGSSVSQLSDHLAEGAANVSRHKRGIPNPKLDFKLEAPSVDWQKRVGSDAIGGSFGVLMLNFLHLQICK